MLDAAILLYDGIEELDFAGPYEVFALAGKVFTVAATPEVKCRHGLVVKADYTFENAPQPDVLVVPGGPVTRENPESLNEVVAYVARAAANCRYVQGVCTGTFIIARTGMLDGRSCTTHYRRRHLLQAKFPNLKLRYARVVADGRFVTTAGVAAGIDGSLFTVSRVLGMEQARKLAKGIEYPWHSSHALHAGTMEDHHEFHEDVLQSKAW